MADSKHTITDGGGAMPLHTIPPTQPQENLWKKYQHLFPDEQPATEIDDDGMLHSHDKTFGKLPAILIHDTGITDGAARLYAHMHWRYGRNRKNFEGRAKMAKHLGVTETTITKRIQELEATDWIVVIERGRSEKGGAYQTPFYHIFESQDDAEYFRNHYRPKEGETIRARPHIEPRKSRKGKGGNPNFKAVTTQVDGGNSSSHGADNSSSHYPEAVYPDSISITSGDVPEIVPSKRTKKTQPPKPKQQDMIFNAIAECGFGLSDASNVNGSGSSIGAVKKIAVKQFELEYGKTEPDILAKVIRMFAATAHKTQWYKTTFEVPFTAYLQNNRKKIEPLFSPPSEPEPPKRYTVPLDEVTGGGS